MDYKVHARWKEELVVECADGALVVELTMGVVTAYFPTPERWHRDAPEWARTHYHTVLEAVRAWCGQKVPLIVEESAWVAEDSLARGAASIAEVQPAPSNSDLPRVGSKTLWRPVGPDELKLIAELGFRRFPPRLPEQPIFYPVCNERYAIEIAERWNAKSDGGGFVTRFQVREDFLASYTPHVVGARDHEEYWIPAENLDAFNDAIVGTIEVVRSFPPPETT